MWCCVITYPCNRLCRWVSDVAINATQWPWYTEYWVQHTWCGVGISMLNHTICKMWVSGLIYRLYSVTGWPIFLPYGLHGQCWDTVNSLWPNDVIWRHRSGSTLAQVMAWCLTAPSHYLNQSWLIIIDVQWHLSEGNFMRYALAINNYNLLNSLGPSDAIWRWRSWSTLVQVMACCLTAPSHYLNQSWMLTYHQ